MKPAKEKPPQAPKKPYRKPVLRRYGAIRTLTENVGNMTINDNGSQPKVKTA